MEHLPMSVTPCNRGPKVTRPQHYGPHLMGFLVVTSNWGTFIEILRVTAVWKIVQSGHGHFDMIFSKFFDEEFFNEAIRMLIYRLRACNKWNSIIQWQSHCCDFSIFQNGARRAARCSSSSLIFSIIFWQIEYFDTWFLVKKEMRNSLPPKNYVIPPFSWNCPKWTYIPMGVEQRARRWGLS